MNKVDEDALQIRQALEQGSLTVDATIAARLQQSRFKALDRQKLAVAQLGLAAGIANVGTQIGNMFIPNTRVLAALMALTFGVVGTYYWNEINQADENEEVDSALLTDDLPVDAFTDQGFEAWLEHSSRSSAE